MTIWSCSYCTLNNPQTSILCEACGSENPSVKSRKSILPKVLTTPISNMKNAVVDIFSVDKARRPPRPPYPQNIVVANSPQIRAPPARPPPQIPAPSTSSSVSTLSNDLNIDYSMNWICNQCYSLNAIAQTTCPSCQTVRRGTHQSNVYDSIYKSTKNSTNTTLCSEITSIVENDDENRARAQYSEIINHCKFSSSTFIDDSFPHSSRSIGNIWEQSQVSIVERLPTELIWLRPHQIFTKDGRKWNWNVFRDPRSSDIEQGSLGDCWLLSAMALIAERPDILEKVVLTKIYNTCGVYQIRVCVDGTWSVVTVDDFFPCRPISQSLVFAVGRKNQLWVPLIEKAVAKRLGNYSKLIGGRTIEGLAILTGSPCETIVIGDSDEEFKELIWARLFSAKEAGFILGCSCGSGNSDVNTSHYTEKGIMPQHSYSILNLTAEGSHRLIRLRNPWGTFVWKGDWSDSWPGWTPELKQKLLFESVSGSFWMSFTDFTKYFDSVDIAKVRFQTPWSDLRIPLQLGGSYDPSDRCVRFIIERPTEMCFSLYHTDGRQTEDRIDLLICVHETTQRGNIGKLICRSPRKLESFVCTGDYFFGPGEYVVICHSMFHLGDQKQPGCLAIHSSAAIFGELIPCKPTSLRDSLCQVLIKEGNETYLHSDILLRSLSKDMGGLILMVDNNLANTYSRVITDCSLSTNVISSRGCLLMADSIPPGTRQITTVLTQFEYHSSYLISHRIPPVQLSTVPQLKEQALDENSIDSMHSPLLENDTIENLHSPYGVYI